MSKQKHFGARLQALIDAQSKLRGEPVTQKALGAAVGLSQGHISTLLRCEDWESLTAHTLAELADELGCTMDFLARGRLPK